MLCSGYPVAGHPLPWDSSFILSHGVCHQAADKKFFLNDGNDATSSHGPHLHAQTSTFSIFFSGRDRKHRAMFHERTLNSKNKDPFVLHCEELHGKCGFHILWLLVIRLKFACIIQPSLIRTIYYYLNCVKVDQSSLNQSAAVCSWVPYLVRVIFGWLNGYSAMTWSALKSCELSSCARATPKQAIRNADIIIEWQ